MTDDITHSTDAMESPICDMPADDMVLEDVMEGEMCLVNAVDGDTRLLNVTAINGDTQVPLFMLPTLLKLFNSSLWSFSTVRTCALATKETQLLY